MHSAINVLFLENDPASIRLFLRKIQTSPVQINVKEARNRNAFINELEISKYDCIIIDDNLPDISGLEALRLSKEKAGDIPVLIYADSVGEEKAAEFMLQGSSEFILKSNSIRLVPAIISLVEKHRERQARLKAEKEKMQSEERFKALAETNVAGIFIYQNDKIVYVNPAAESITGYSENELMQMKFLDLIHPELRNAFEEQLKRSQIDKSMNRFEIKIIDKFGTEKWLDLATSYIKYDDTIAVLSIGLDITAKKDVEEKLKISEQQYRALFEENPQAMFICEVPGWKILVANTSAMNLYGYNQNEFQGMKIKDLTVIENEDNADLQLAIEGIHGQRKKDGEIFEADVVANVIEYSNKKLGLVMISDVTHQKRIVEMLRISEEKYRDIVTWAPIGIYQTSPVGKFLMVNQCLAKMLRFDSPDELMGVNIQDIFSNRRDYENMIAATKQNEVVKNAELMWKGKNGSPIWVQVFLHVIKDKNGEVLYYEGFVYDVTEKKRLETQFRQAHKMESIGILAGGIAHDFNNILNIVHGYATMAKQHIGASDRLMDDINVIINATERGTKLVRQLLTFAKKTEVRIESVNINELLEEMAQMLAATFPKDIEIILKLDSHVPEIDADQNQLQQAFLNLAMNARDAMPQGGKLVISTKVEELNATWNKILKVPAESYIHVQFTDTGHGMDEEIKSKIFDPFFTTKENGKGTGLGLSVVYGIVGSHNGFIDVESEPNKGTTMHIFLPVNKCTEESEVSYKDEVEVQGGNETILIIEDEIALKDYLKEILETKGYKIIEASNGEEALNIFYENEKKISLILTDLGMPKLDGIKLIKKIRKKNEQVKILLTSGNIEPEKRLEILEAGASGIIFKPYTRKDILFRVRQLLDSNV